VSEAFYMNESIERLVDPQGTVVTTTTYEQNPVNLAVSKTTTADSKGGQTEVVTKYPVDYGNVENIDVLKAGNIISVPVKTETSYNDKLVNGVVIKYTDFGQPQTVYRYENNVLVNTPAHDGNEIVPPYYALRSQFSYDASNNKLI